VDLKGQLSNPPGKLETFAALGSRAPRDPRTSPAKAPAPTIREPAGDARKEKGQHSNPSRSGSTRQVQRRLRPSEIDQLLAAYLAGDLVRDIAARFGLSRTTVIGHVTRRGLPHRADNDWTPDELAAAASLYAAGHSLAEVGLRLGVNASTVANRFRNAGTPIRRRRGWPPT